MPLQLGAAVARPNPTPIPNMVSITVNASVTGKPSTRAGARCTLPVAEDVWFQLPNGLFKRVFLPEFTLTTIPDPVAPSFLIVSKIAPPVTFSLDIEVIDLDSGQSLLRGDMLAVI
jgi:hypothetical protein